jgi:hypothetical protein
MPVRVTLVSSSCEENTASMILNIALGVAPGPQETYQALVSHLHSCKNCHTTFHVLLYALAPSQMHTFHPPEDSNHYEPADFVEFHSDGVLDDAITLFIETWEYQGKERAMQQQPELAKHMELCEDCRSHIELAHAMLHDIVQHEPNDTTGHNEHQLVTSIEDEVNAGQFEEHEDDLEYLHHHHDHDHSHHHDHPDE